MFRRLTCLLVSGVVSLAACGEQGNILTQFVGGTFTVEDAAFVADLIDNTTTGVLDDFFDLTGGDPTSAPALTDVPVVWTRTFERSRPCHEGEGGTLTVAGTGTSVWDAAAVTCDVVVSSGTMTRTNCKYTRDGVVITLNGNAVWTHERHYLNYAPTGTWITTYVGDFDRTKSTGESDSCTYRLTRKVDTAANTRTLTGMSCENDINRTDTWRG